MTARENHSVELVSASGEPLGVASVAAAHQPPGRLHRAFSVVLLDADGRVLLQQRSRLKTRFALRWANTCCGHPPPGTSVLAAAVIRLGEELGLAAVPLREVGVFTYRATDDASGRVEEEYDHVLVGLLQADAVINPNPAEVSAVTWVTIAELRDRMAVRPETYVPWLPGVLGVVYS
jgi:isopentenyl-diphosphate delta-isomerase